MPKKIKKNSQTPKAGKKKAVKTAPKVKKTKKDTKKSEDLPKKRSIKKNKSKREAKQTAPVSIEKKEDGIKLPAALAQTLAENERKFMKMGKGGPMVRKILQNPKMRGMLKGFISRKKGEVGKEELQFEVFSKPMDLFQQLGFFDAIDTASSKEELIDLKKVLEYRADWLEVILEDTLFELEQIEKVLSGKKVLTSDAENGKENKKRKKSSLT